MFRYTRKVYCLEDSIFTEPTTEGGFVAGGFFLPLAALALRARAEIFEKYVHAAQQ